MFIAGTILVLLALHSSHGQSQLTLPPLPYAYNELEPVLSEKLMRLHHDGHMQSYVNQTNIIFTTMLNDPQKPDQFKEFVAKPIETILTELQTLPDHYHIGLRHQAGGYLNHKLFFSMLRRPTATGKENQPTGVLLEAINKAFESFEKFQDLFSLAAKNLFGSGWVWMYIDGQTKQLVINYTANQDNPIMFNKNHIVILGIDCWEHAYYPVYENRRAEYIENFWRIINWSHVSDLFIEGQRKRLDL